MGTMVKNLIRNHNVEVGNQMLLLPAILPDKHPI